ncbi:hypothetical protein L4D76_17620 [Photobacterium sagamiensis]|uniref:hypothetical protein n=1 Tax=Photobacterium sagamiensis TaxID=2910241 RepID=UPI003D0D1839
MRPASPVRYVSTTPRSPSRLRSSAFAPRFKAKKAPQHVADVHTMPAPEPVSVNPEDNEQAA